MKSRKSNSSPFGMAVVGLGTVGGSVAKLLIDEIDVLREKTGLPISLNALVDVDFANARRLGLDEALYTEDLGSVLADEEIRIVVELVGGLTIARTIMEKALKAGKHVVTANKALLAHYGKELFDLARKNDVSIGFEASCGGGIPIIRALVDGLLANEHEALYGIVNGTSNFILTEMVEKGRTYTAALRMAQEGGLAEADPSLDVNGKDAAHKLALLGSLAFRKYIPLEAVPVEGIENLDLFDVSTGRELGYVLKLLALARWTSKGLDLAVTPAFLPSDHPLARVSGPFNAVSVYGKTVGHTMYYGRGAGGAPTSSAVTADILSIALGTWPLLYRSLDIWPDRTDPAELLDFDEAMHRHYLRFMIEDRPGTVAAITAALAERGISLNAFVQKESHMGDLVPVVITTHEAREGDLRAAFHAIQAMPAVHDPAVRLRIVDEHAESL